jgi:DNA-binding NtrC family response regulator
MARSKVIVVSDDHEIIQKARNFAYTMGLNLEIFSIGQWEEKNMESANTVQSLISGQTANSNVIPFPTAGAKLKKVKTINELESVAIENAIHEYRGNLTEAAKALGIGRATLYRKVKQYEIDTALARRKKSA